VEGFADENNDIKQTVNDFIIDFLSIGKKIIFKHLHLFIYRYPLENINPMQEHI